MGRALTYGSICSGVEAASVAWAPLGWRCRFLSEIDPFPRAVLETRYPDIPIHGDFTSIEESTYGPIDLLVGGTPCQSFSVAGRRGGLADARGNLTLQFSALARRLRPRWIVWENVPGVRSLDDGRVFGAILARFAGHAADRFFEPPDRWRNFGVVESVGPAGYGLAWRLLDAEYVRVDGFPRAVPQPRKRIFVVGYFGDWRPAASVLFEPQGLSGDPPPRREKGKGSAADVAPSLTGSGRGVARAGESRGQDPVEEDGTGRGTPIIPVARDSGVRSEPPEISRTLNGSALGMSRTGGFREAEQLIPYAIQEGAVRENPDIGPGGKGVRDDGAAYTLEGRRPQIVAAPEVGNTLTARPGKGINSTIDEGQTPVVVGFNPRQDPDANGNGVAHTLDGRQSGPAVAFQPRYFSECATERRAGGKPSEIAPTLRGERTLGSDASPVVAYHENQEGNISDRGDCAASVRADPSRNYQLIQSAADRYAVRRLTPRECERLQGLPDDRTRIGWRGKPPEECPDGPRYKAIGNSMAVNVMRWIGRRIEAVEEIVGD